MRVVPMFGKSDNPQSRPGTDEAFSLQANSSVACSKTPCPTLTCSKDLRYREKPTDCCQKCRAPESVTDTARSRSDVGRGSSPLGDESSSGRCSFNNRWYPEGSVFSPKIAHLGSLKCVICKCQVRHQQKLCPALSLTTTFLHFRGHESHVGGRNVPHYHAITK